MVNCSAFGCNSDSRKKMPSITFHRFPINQEICSAWLKNMKLNDWIPTKNSRLCSKHFEERFFYKTELKVKLLNLAVPTIFPELPTYLQQKLQSNRNLKTPKLNSPAPSNIHVETSVSVRLKNKLHLVELRSKEKSRKIRVLSQSLKRCRKRIQTLKQLIKNLRSKNVISQENSDLLNGLTSFTRELLLEKNGNSDKYSEELKDFDTIDKEQELNYVELYVEDCPTDTYIVSLN